METCAHTDKGHGKWRNGHQLCVIGRIPKASNDRRHETWQSPHHSQHRMSRLQHRQNLLSETRLSCPIEEAGKHQKHNVWSRKSDENISEIYPVVFRVLGHDLVFEQLMLNVGLFLSIQELRVGNGTWDHEETENTERDCKQSFLKRKLDGKYWLKVRYIESVADLPVGGSTTNQACHRVHPFSR